MKPFGPLAGKTVGINFERHRMFWLLLRKSWYTNENIEAWYDNATLLASRAIKPKAAWLHFADEPPRLDADCSSDSGSDSDLAETAGPKPKRRCVEVRQMSATFRKTHGLPKFGSADGHPYSSTAPDDVRRQLTARELEVLDSAFLYVDRCAGGVTDKLAVDVSQSPSRLPCRTSGILPSPIKRSLIWYKGRLLDPKTMFFLMGWPRNSVRLPKKVSSTEMRTLIGNMCSPPQAGLVIASFLAIHPDFKISDKCKF